MIYRNSEHYWDPTVGEVMRKIVGEDKVKRKKERGEWFMRYVYIASPYKGNREENIINAKKYCLFAAKNDCVPMCPHLYFTQFLNDDIPKEREMGMHLGIQLLRRCHEMWLFGDIISDGMKRELEFAKRSRIVVRYFDTECKKDEDRY